MAITATRLACPSVFGPLSFSVPAGGLLVVTGDHGSGKSTLLRCLAGVGNTPAT